MLKAIKYNACALEYASVALKDDCEIVLEAVKSDGNALKDAFTMLQDGGFQEHLILLKRNVHSVSKQNFLATIFFGTKAALSAPGGTS